MILKTFTIYDSKAETYANPFYAKATGEAIRMFTDEANNPESMLCKHSADYTLFEIGSYDDQTGRIEILPAFTALGLAIDYKQTSHQFADLSSNPVPAPDGNEMVINGVDHDG